MTDPIAAFMQANGLAQPAFAPDSRYHGLPTAQARLADGRTVAYVTRRFLPPPENFATVQTLTLAAGQRPDQLAAQLVNPPEPERTSSEAAQRPKPRLLAPAGVASQFSLSLRHDCMR